LCGPYFDGVNNRDRRKIILDYINTLDFQRNIFQPIPFIIDPLFDESTIKNRNLNLSLIEEILANVAYKTYIFLDTLSTAVELGLFMNNSQNNKIKCIVPKGNISSLGEFIRLSIDTRGNSVDTIECDYDIKIKNSKNYYYFTNDKIEQNIKADIDKDFLDYINKMSFEDIIFRNNHTFPYDANVIHYSIIENNIIFNIGQKTLFYFILSSRTMTPLSNVTHKLLTSTYIDCVYEDVINLISQAFQLNCRETASVVSLMNLNSKVYSININSNNSHDIRMLIYHMINIIQIIQLHNEKEVKKGAKVLSLAHTSPVERKFSYAELHSYYDLFNITKKDRKIMNSYTANQAKYINEKHITINRKTRKIVTYRNNKYGFALRCLHNKINSVLGFFQFDSAANAYIKGRSIITAVKEHNQSKIFLKNDVKDFFQSIKRKKLEKVILSLNDDNKNACLNSIFGLDLPSDNRKKYFSPKISQNGLKEILNCCYYKNKLPLGFITSPALSNIYMIPFDEQMSYMKNVVYTRYADDILVSVKNKADELNLYISEKTIKSTLKCLNLELNTSKRLKVEFKLLGDHIKFLGINIVNDLIYNRLTISQKYIIDTIKMERYNNPSKISKVKGRRQFIKNISDKSYQKYLHIRKIKLGY
jgi:hypothetical protein